MSSPSSAGNQAIPNDDLTTRARIRSAALVEFAAHGFKGASIRGIAKAAGVSPGLVQHHFGTKEGLREACDAHVMDFLHSTQMSILQHGSGPLPSGIAERLDEIQPVIDYLIMALASGSETANRWFKQITDYTHEALTSGRLGPPLDESDDSLAVAAAQAAMALGVTAFYRNIQQVLQEDDDAELVLRVGRARLLLASDRIIGPDTRQRLHEVLDQYERNRTTGKPPPER